MTEAWLIRHGESAANAGAATSDPASIPLTAIGLVQAKAISAAFDREPALIITSPYLRTMQTAQPTLERFPDARRLTWQIQEFTYLDPQNCANTTAAQRRPLVAAYWERCDPEYIDGPGAESFSQLHRRVTAMLSQLQAIPGFKAVFTHGQFMRLALLIADQEMQNIDELMFQFRKLEQNSPIGNGTIARMKFDYSGAQ